MAQARKPRILFTPAWEALVSALGDTPSHEVQEDAAKCGGDSCGGKQTCGGDDSCQGMTSGFVPDSDAFPRGERE